MLIFSCWRIPRYLDVGPMKGKAQILWDNLSQAMTDTPKRVTKHHFQEARHGRYSVPNTVPHRIHRWL